MINSASSERVATFETRAFLDPVINDGWEYGGSGRETVDFFRQNSNYDELITGMTPEQRSDFQRWTNGAFMGGQQYIGFDNMTAEDQQATRNFDAVLDRATLDKGITVRRLATSELILGRGNKRPTLEQLQGMKGQTVVSKGNMSTGAGARGLTIGYSGRNKTVDYVMKFPAGSKGAGMWIGDDRIHGWGVRQREFMTNRDIKFVVGNTRYNRRTDKYEVELIYAGRNEHDYGRRGR
jgi:hypothetical protein